jgi:hypothetical protein
MGSYYANQQHVTGVPSTARPALPPRGQSERRPLPRPPVDVATDAQELRDDETRAETLSRTADALERIAAALERRQETDGVTWKTK